MFTLKVLFYKVIALGFMLFTRLVPQPRPLLYCGRDSVLDLATFIHHSDARRLLLVTDADIARLGLAEPLCQRLRQSGIEVVLFAEVKPDPSDRVIQAGINQLRQSGCDAVIGFGGGSSLDAAKLIAALGPSRQPLHKSVGIMKIRGHGLPLYLVPTTAGTGSEVTIAAVMTDSRTQRKAVVVTPKLLPLAVALDAALMTGMPAAITAMTGVDALTHAVEAYLSRNASADTDRLARMAIKMIFQHLPIVCADGSNLESREAMAQASCYAGLAFSRAGLGYVHGIAHQLGARYHIPHGLANALVLPHVLRYSEPACRTRLQQLAQLNNDYRARTDNTDLSDCFIAQVSQLLQQLDLPTTLDALKTEHIPALARDALKESHYLYPVPAYMNQRQCCQLIAKLLPCKHSTEAAP